MADRFGQIVISSTDDSFQPLAYTVAQDPRKINGVELNITPGGGLQVGAPRLRRISGRLGIVNVSDDAPEGLSSSLDRFEALRGQSVFIDHFLNRDRTIRWVVEDASPDHDGIRGSGWVFGTFSAVEDVSPDLAAGLPLGSIVIPSAPVIEDEVGEDEVVPDFGTYGNVVDWFIGTNNVYAGPRTRSVISTSAPPGFKDAEDFTERNKEAATSLGEEILDWFKPEKYPTLDEFVESIPTPGDIGSAIEEVARDTGEAIGSWWDRVTQPTQRRTNARNVVTT